jgi:hypothetical protein
MDEFDLSEGHRPVEAAFDGILDALDGGIRELEAWLQVLPEELSELSAEATRMLGRLTSLRSRAAEFTT